MDTEAKTYIYFAEPHARSMIVEGNSSPMLVPITWRRLLQSCDWHCLRISGDIAEDVKFPLDGFDSWACVTSSHLHTSAHSQDADCFDHRKFYGDISILTWFTFATNEAMLE